MFKNLIKLSKNAYECSPLVNYVVRRQAGHSKWQNIRHIKGAKDAQKAAVFLKLSRQIRMAVQEGGSPDPALNLKLEQVIEQAKRVSMPMSSVQNAIRSAQSDKRNCKSHIIELKGPGSCIILVEVFTDSLMHVKQQVAGILKKHAAKISDGGGMHFFDQKGVVEAECPKEITGDNILEVATEDAIEAGAEDVELSDDNRLLFTCGPLYLKKVTDELQKRKYNVTSASVEYIPNRLQTLSEEELQMCMKLYDKLENLQDIVRISDNIAM